MDDDDDNNNDDNNSKDDDDESIEIILRYTQTTGRSPADRSLHPLRFPLQRIPLHSSPVVQPLCSHEC
jgi:hypothetical protein